MADKPHTVSDNTQTWIWVGVGILALVAIAASMYLTN
jgi:hypothetical protein